jgi:hypothetical protein
MKLPNYLSRNIELIIANTLTLATQTHAFTQSATLFARRAVQLATSKERVDKLSYPFTGPWRITASLKGVSCDLEQCWIPNRKMKKHALDLSTYPLELVSFEPIDGPDNQYG